MKTIDTSIEGFRYAGINLSTEQFEDLCNINLQMRSEENIPVFNIMVLLKVLGLLPPEMVNEEGDNKGDNNFDDDFENRFEKRYGKRKEI